MASWKDVNGKQIWFKTDTGNVFESLVIANPKIGISVKPLDPEDVLSKEPDGWMTPPSDPDFFFVCTNMTEKENPETFNDWINALAEDKEYFTARDISSSFDFGDGSCPFA